MCTGTNTTTTTGRNDHRARHLLHKTSEPRGVWGLSREPQAMRTCDNTRIAKEATRTVEGAVRTIETAKITSKEDFEGNRKDC